MPSVSFVGVAVIQARAVQACTRAVGEAAEDLVGKAQPLARVDTGTLRASMRWAMTGPMKAIIHDGVIYGVMLETGTENMAPRPFFTPVIVDWRQNKFVPFARQFGLFR